MCVSTECAGSSRLVGTFLSVCALTVLCGLVVVAVSRLLLQKRGRTPGGVAEDAGYHCTGKVSSQKSSTLEAVVSAAGFKLRGGWGVPGALRSIRDPLNLWDIYVNVFCLLKPGVRHLSLLLEVQLYFTFPPQLPPQCLDLWCTAPLRRRKPYKFQQGGTFWKHICLNWCGLLISVWKPLIYCSSLAVGHLHDTADYRLW